MKAGFVFLALAASAAAQKVTIALPKENTEVKAGDNLFVEIDRPDSETPSTDVAVIIGLQPCGSDCDAVAANSARVLFHGPYTPKHIEGHDHVSHNYTVKIPRNTAAGKALLQVAHFFYVGNGNQPQLQTLNVAIQVTN